MPILAPLADFADVNRSIAVTAYQSASGLVNYITPTSAVVMGGLVLAKVRYDHYLRFVLPFVGIAALVVCAFLALGTASLLGLEVTLNASASSEVGKLRRSWSTGPASSTAA